MEISNMSEDYAVVFVNVSAKAKELRKSNSGRVCRLLKHCPNGQCLAIKHHQTSFGDQTFYRLDTLFYAVWWCLIKFEGYQTFHQTTENISFVLVFDGRSFVCLDSRVKHVWRAHANHASLAACLSLSLVQYFNPLTARVKLWVIHSFLTSKKLLWTFLKLKTGEIESEETPSRKRKQRKGKTRKWNEEEPDL